MARNAAADEVMKGKNFGYLGRFRKREVLDRGHNQTVADCQEVCKDLTIPNCVEKCMAPMAEETEPEETEAERGPTVEEEISALEDIRSRFRGAFK